MATTLAFRNAEPSDADGIMRVQRALSDHSPGGSAWERLKASIQAVAGQWRIGLADGKVVTSVHAEPCAVWFGRCRIPWADVGGVSVMPELQGRGLGTQAMQDVVRWMPTAGYVVSRLGGLVRFYSRFGYRTFPRQYVEFPVPRTVSAGTARLPFPEVIRRAFESGGTVRPMDRTGDGAGAWDVLEAFSRHRTGCRSWDRPADNALPQRAAVVFEEDGRVRGLASYHDYGGDHSSFEGHITAYLLAYESGCVAALDALVKHLLRLAYDQQARRVTALLPFDAALVGDLDQIAVEYNLCRTIGPIAGNMIRILSLRFLLESIADELARRVQGVRWRGRIGLEVGEDQITLAIGDGTVAADDDPAADVTLSLDQAEMLRMVLGIMPPVWPRKLAPGHPACAAMSAMFPPVSGGFTT